MRLLLIAAAIVTIAVQAQAQDSRPAPISLQDASKAYEKKQRGEQLTPQEQALLQRVKDMQARNGAGQGRPASGAASRPAGGAASRPAGNAPADVTKPVVYGGSEDITTPRTKTGAPPLDQMTAKDTYKGQDGGLYGAGKNEPPKEQLQAARTAIAKIQPLDKDGKPTAGGKIVLMSIGMSNTMNEFSRFKLSADEDRQRNTQVVVVNGALGGQTVSEWAKADSRVWAQAQDRLKLSDVTPKQVQVVWLKQAIGGPFRFGDFPRHAQAFEEFLIRDINQIMEHYPNVRVIYLSSRIYGGYAKINLQPEPYAYEEAFAVRWVIQKQIKGDQRLNFDPAKGKVAAPVLLWGPYLWADGVTPRKSDGLSYQQSDFAPGDGIHPAAGAQQKVSRLLTDFFKNDLNASWYVKRAAGTSKPAQK